MGTDESGAPVKTKAVLIDASTMTVLWMNESAAQDSVEATGEGQSQDAAKPVLGAPVEQAVPLAATLGVPDALRTVAETGVPRHLSANLVSTSKGSVKIVASVYRTPDGALLLLMENAWQPGRDGAGASASRRGGARKR